MFTIPNGLRLSGLRHWKTPRPIDFFNEALEI